MSTASSVVGDFSLTNSNCHYGYCISAATHSEEFRYVIYFPSMPFTVSYWQYLNEQAYYPLIFNGGPYGAVPNSNENTFYFWFQSPPNIIWHDTNGYGPVSSSVYFPLNTWTFLTLVFTSTQVFLYANGGSQLDITLTANWGANFPLASIFVTGGHYDDLSVFPYALTASQVATLYNSGLPGICTCPTGTYQSGTECVNICSPGFYNNMGVCTWCPVNSYCPGNTVSPIPCPSGTYSMAGSGNLLNCTCGYFYNFDSAIVPSVNPLNMTTKNSVAGDFSLTNSNCHSGYCPSAAYFQSNQFKLPLWILSFSFYLW